VAANLLGCDTLSLGEWLPTFRETVAPPYSLTDLEGNTIILGVGNRSTSDNVTCPRIYVSELSKMHILLTYLLTY